MKYLTQILGKPVVGPDEARLGRVADVIAGRGGRLPQLNAVVIKTAQGERAVPFGDIQFAADPQGPQGSGRIEGPVRLRVPLDRLTPYQAQPDDLRLRRDLLDRQIVDVQGHRVVRVCDVRVAEFRDRYGVVGVDSSFRALLRQFPFAAPPIEALARRFNRPLRSHLIAWDDVHTLEPGTEGGSLRLKVSQDAIARLHPADIADIVEQLTPQQGADVIEALDTETAADALAEADTDVQVQIIRHLDDETAGDILEEMEPDEAADLLDDLPESRSDALLLQMPAQEAADVKELMGYDDDTAGGLMTTEFVALPSHLTCEQTLNRLRELAPRAETIYYVYVVDEVERLVGVLSLRDLVVSAPSILIRDIMVQNVRHVYADAHADEVAQIIGRYNLLALPVVSDDERLLGIITVDDTLNRLLPPERRRRLPALATGDTEADA